MERNIMAERIKGKVKSFNTIKGYGFLSSPNREDVFFHYSTLKTGDYRTIKEGQAVEFTLDNPKALQASDVVLIDNPTSLQNTPVTSPAISNKPNQPPPKVKVESVVAHPKQSRRLSIFLCHSSYDKPQVRKLYKQLVSDQFAPWLDEENLLPGQDWRQEIPKAVRRADVVIVCLSRNSINKAGYVQKEITDALDVADEQPEGRIFLIPLKLEECEVPNRLSRWHWVNYFDENGYRKLLNALHARAEM